MHESITIAVVGSMLKVSGSRMATPLGPPRPGSTPTNMPSTRPRIMNASVLKVISTLKPWSRSPNASIAPLLEPEGRFQRALRHDHVESDIEGDEHGDGKNQSGENRFP